MSKKVLTIAIIVLVLGLADNVQADTIWTDATGDHFWSTPENWSGSKLPAWTDTYSSVVKISLLPGPIVMNNVVAEMQCMLLGYDNFIGELTMNGGALKAKTWVTLGYNEGSRGTLNMNSGAITVGNSLNVGTRGLGALNMTGGTIAVGMTFRIGDQANLDGGVITANNFMMQTKPGTLSVMDVKAGTLIIDGDESLYVQRCIDNGWVIAYDGQGILQLDYDLTNEDKTTLKAVHMLSPNPVYSSNVLPTNVNQLQWMLPESNQPGGVVTCDVYFGTNPVVKENPKVVDCQAVESVSVALTPNMIYYWALNLYDFSISATQPYMLSSIFTFNTLNQPPIVNAGADVVTWLEEGVVRIGDLDATITDDDNRPLPYTVQWTVVKEPNEGVAVIETANAEDAGIALSAMGEYVLQLEAFDGEYTGSDTVTINVYNDSCEAAQSLLDYVPLVGDLNGDCKVDDVDLALLEENWLQDNSLAEEWLKLD